MKNKILFLLLILLPLAGVHAQQIYSTLYKGTVDNKAVSLYLKMQPNDCNGKDMYMAIYRYGTSGSWIKLDVALNSTTQSYCMIEHNFTGIMVLLKKLKALEGIWISPDTKRQLKVQLTQQPLPADIKEAMEKALEAANYNADDC